MDCTCSCNDNWEGPELVVEHYPKARKPHKCCECERTIQPGERYEYVRGLWDGEFETYKTCLGCFRLRDDICSGYIYGELAEVVWDCFGLEIGG